MTRIDPLVVRPMLPVRVVAPAVGRPGAPSFDTALAAVQRQAAREGALRAGRYMAVGALPEPAPFFGSAVAVQTQATAAAPAPARVASPAPATGSAQTRFLQLKPQFQQAEATTGVPWQIQAAQWALETGWGAATPRDVVTGQESHNLFGIKGTGSAGSVQAATTEVEQGRTVQTVAGFRAYSSVADSVEDHARLLTSPYYAPAHAAGKDLRAWTEQLGPERLGYATDPQYGQKLWQIITQNGWDKSQGDREST